MVDDVESVARTQAAATIGASATYTPPNTPATQYLQAITDAVVLSARARQVIDSMGTGQTVAEAWLKQVTAPPDLTQPRTTSRQGAVPGAGTGAQGDSGAADTQATMRRSMNRAMADLSWLFDAMSPPRVDTSVVARVLAERMAADAVGTTPPLPQVVAQAEQSNSIPALYVENLSVTTGRDGTTATVDRVALTTVDPSLGQSGTDRPVVLDVGGQATQVPESQLLPGEKKLREAGEPRSLLVVRQGGGTLPEGTLHVKLDVLLPLS